MATKLTFARPARPDDAPTLAELRAQAWRGAYRGIIPGVALERMIASADATGWRRVLRGTDDVLVLECCGVVAGYARMGRARGRSGGGEIYELYLDPAHQGIGLGTRLFRATQGRLQAAGHARIVVWALEDNIAGCAFYSAMGGRLAARRLASLGGLRLAHVAYVWERQAAA